MFTSKCASRHNGVHFFDIATSKSGPTVVCFVHFHFEMCFAPQRRALFRHLNFQKCSETQVFCTILTSKSASRHNGVQFFISPLARWLRTRRFSEPNFRPSGATKHRKNTDKHSVSRLSYLFAHLHLLSSDLFSSDLSPLWLFSRLALRTSAFSSVHIVGSLTSKLPSKIYKKIIKVTIRGPIWETWKWPAQWNCSAYPQKCYHMYNISLYFFDKKQ